MATKKTVLARALSVSLLVCISCGCQSKGTEPRKASASAPEERGEAGAGKAVVPATPDASRPHDGSSAVAVADAPGTEAAPSEASALLLPDERHLTHVRQLTFGGQNAEAYFDETGERLVFQSTREGVACDQIFTMKIDGTELARVSTGLGRTTCAYLLQTPPTLLYASTHAADEACPPTPDYATMGYVWPLYDAFEIYAAKPDGSELHALTQSPGYDAEATVHPGSGQVVFTSVRDGDLELYTMKLDGSDVTRLTHAIGYDGGAFFSADGSKIVFRAERPTGERLVEYKEALAKGLYRPGNLEIYVMNADGTDIRQVTNNGAANFAPFFHPDGQRIIFSSNVAATDPQKRNFDIHIVNLDGTHQERITTHEAFDGFPMFSPDGTKLVFASNRNGKVRGETNVFIADWVEP